MKSSKKYTTLLFGIVLGIGFQHVALKFKRFLSTSSSSSSSSTISSEDSINSSKNNSSTWTLIVTLTFQSKQDMEHIIQDWDVVSRHCEKHEPFLYHYKLGQSDSNPLMLHIVERYESKEKHLALHKHGEEFLKFRPKLKALQDSGRVTVEGFSFQELGYGFAR
eukprot:CAMPEP_0176503582 /NCGR_PEP_ID=MMETSP0200_2-20121128/15441_1 /TAXON_ID=947934 /ORGANISM="Chaetoceros sp., Strain GSL56" /LENGTH=163 /DNA_ID=CAMNT_0017902885 /DNA_START=83 /DNA_END=574 /DNA_ORIENTATION=-